jgi:hypothetical protein
MTPPQSPRRPAIVCPGAPRRARRTRSPVDVQQGWQNTAAKNAARRLRLPLLGGGDHMHAEAGPGVEPGASKPEVNAQQQGMTAQVQSTSDTAGAVEKLVEAGWPRTLDLEPEALFGFAFSLKGL